MQKRSRTTTTSERPKNPAAVALGRLGGLKGGKARVKKMSAAEHRAWAVAAAGKRWGKAKKH